MPLAGLGTAVPRPGGARNERLAGPLVQRRDIQPLPAASSGRNQSKSQTGARALNVACITKAQPRGTCLHIPAPELQTRTCMACVPCVAGMAGMAGIVRMARVACMACVPWFSLLGHVDVCFSV